MGGEQVQAYLDCLTEQGVEIAQPGAPGGNPPSQDRGASGGDAAGPPPGGPGGFAGLDESDPAVAACADLRPEMPERPAQPDGTAGSERSNATASSTPSRGPVCSPKPRSIASGSVPIVPSGSASR